MNTFGRALQLFRPEADRLAVALLLLLLAIGANLLKPWPVALVVDSVLGDRPLPAWLRSLADPADKGNLITLLAVCLLVLQAARSALMVAHHYLALQVGLSGLRRVRNDLFACLQRLSLRVHQSSRGKELTSRAAWDACAFQAWFQQGVVTPVSATLSLLCMGVVMWRLNTVLTLVALTVVPLLLLVLKQFGPKLTTRSQSAQQADSHVSAYMQQTIAALPLIQGYTREDYEESGFTSRSAAAMEKRLTQHGWELGYWLAIAVVFGLGTAGLIWFGAKQVQAGHLSTGELLIFLAFLPQFHEPLQQLSRTGSAFAHTAAGIRRVFEILDTPEEVKDSPQARPVLSVRESAALTAPAAPGKRAASPRTPDARTLICEGAIEFDHVSFAYQKSQPVLRDITFRLEPGQSLAIFGPAGAGKTTLLNLFPRFFDPTAGAVRLDGVDLRELRVRDLRRQVALVLQEPIVLPASLAENIAYGEPRASRRAIEEAARAAHAEKFIEKLPNGYNTIIGEGGTRLSPGERQRLNLARAFLKDAPVLIVDEPAGVMDPESEALVAASLTALAAGRTTLMVASRPQLLHAASRILVLQDGSVVQTGTPAELAAQQGSDARMLAEPPPTGPPPIERRG